MIKFIAAGLWLCAACVGALFYSFQLAGAQAGGPGGPAMLGGLDYVKTDVLSVPVVQHGGIVGYFLIRLVYTADPVELKRLSVPAETLLTDQVYTFLFANPGIDFTRIETIDLDGLRNNLRDSINKRVGEELIHDVMVEQLDFLSKQEIRDNTIRRRTAPQDKKAEKAEGDHAAAEKPAH
jgi:hypothetical protein